LSIYGIRNVNTNYYRHASCPDEDAREEADDRGRFDDELNQREHAPQAMEADRGEHVLFSF
jgi:hypothetical protein